MLVKIAKYTGFCVYRRPYLIWSPVIVNRTEEDTKGKHTKWDATNGQKVDGAKRRKIKYNTAVRHLDRA